MITKQINFNKKIKDKQNYAKNYNCRGFVSFQAFYFKIFVNELCKETLMLYAVLLKHVNYQALFYWVTLTFLKSVILFFQTNVSSFACLALKLSNFNLKSKELPL